MIHSFSHLNPYHDPICMAAVIAHWLSGRGITARALLPDEANRETLFIFETAGFTLLPRLTFPLQHEQAWLVDFTEPVQGPADLLLCNIVGIIDHYRLGGLVTQLPPAIFIRPIGISATLL